jgi:solute:Na+ symporter, SSS family
MNIEFRPLDVAAIVAYLSAMAVMGVYFARKNDTTEDYFVGNRAFPGWVIGLSMLGTSISSVTFLAFPAAAFSEDWRQVVPNLFLPVGAVVAIVVFIPFFRRGRLTSAFEYLGDRYGLPVRLYGTFSFILLQLVRLGIILYLVSIPMKYLTGAPIELVIVLAGIFIAFYTVAGGIEAVIWTDVLQAVVLLLGGFICFGYIALNLPDGIPQIFEVAAAHKKFSVGSFDWDLNEKTFWTVAILGVFNWLTMYSSDQNFVQRYAAAKSLKDARRATAIYSAVAVPTWTFFFFLGTSIWVYYRVLPEESVAGLHADDVFPYFILTKIPAGIAGVVIAGVLAAAMSSLDSSINAISTVSVVDVLRPYLAPGRDDRFYLRTARLLATVTAGAMIGGAILFSRLPKESMNDIVLIVGSVFGGCLLGLFLLGFFTTRVDGVSALIALALAILLNVYLMLIVLTTKTLELIAEDRAGDVPMFVQRLAQSFPESLMVEIHAYWVGVVVNLVFMVSAYSISLCRRRPPQGLDGLTIWTQRPEG